MARALVAVLVLTLAQVANGAATLPAGKIEARLESRLAEAMTTPAMVAAYDEAVLAYRAEISRVFEVLVRGLPARQSASVVESQRAWLAYLAAMRVSLSYVQDAPGTIHRVLAMSDLLDIQRHRLDELTQMFLESPGLASGDESVPDAEWWCRDDGPHVRLVDEATDPLGPSDGERRILGLAPRPAAPPQPPAPPPKR